MFHVKHDFYKLPFLFKDLTDVALKKAVVRSVNRAADTVRKDGAIILRQHYRLPMTGSSKGGSGQKPPGLRDMIVLDKAKYNRKDHLASFQSKVRTSDKPISLIHFVVGKKEPRPQKGIPIRRRRLLNVRISQKRAALAKAFIAKGRGGAVQVFRRGMAGKLIKQSVPSINVVFNRPAIRSRMMGIALKRYVKEMEHNVPFYIGQIKMKSGPAR